MKSNRYYKKMILKANIQEAVRSLTSAKQRTILALLGIVIGIGSVIAMVSVGTIVQQESLRQFKEMGTDILKVQKEFSSGIQKKSDELKMADIMTIPQGCPDIGEVSPQISMFGTMKYRGKPLSVPAMGITRSFFDLFKVPIQQGRGITDLDNHMFYCVVGKKVAQFLSKNGVADFPGTKITFQDRIFIIIGKTSEVPAGGMRPYEINDGIMIPITTAMRFPDRPEIRTITARLSAGGSTAAATQQIRTYFKKKSKDLKLRVISAEELIAKMKKQMQLFTLLLGAIGSISLIVGGVGVMNVMLVSVTERRKEIGIRRALGAMKYDIQSQFLIESIILCFFGGMIGIGIGIGASSIIAKFSNWQFIISYNAILLGVGVSAAVGIFFGFYPARQAADLNPIEALRSE